MRPHPTPVSQSIRRGPGPGRRRLAALLAGLAALAGAATGLCAEPKPARTDHPRPRTTVAPPAAPATPAAATGETPAKPKPRGIHYIYLVRHGIYDRVDSLSDETANGLNAQGHEQARRTGERLRALPVRYGHLVSSNYRRAWETAQDIGALLGVPVERDSLWHECTMTAARTDIMATTTPGEAADCEANMAAAWNKYMTPSPDSTVVDIVVCHGNVIRWCAMKAIGADTRRWGSLDVANGSITVISVGADGTPRLAVFSDAAHIPPGLQTWTGRGPGWKPPGS